MLLRLVEPTRDCYWLLMAEGLRDPDGWSRFLPVSFGSDRHRFEATAQSFPEIFLQLRKNLLKPGVSALEYEFRAEEDLVLEHAMGVAEALGVELALGKPKAA